ncbi:hypothetical protein EmuJ_000350000 [Echinococcus multilocularis]|uniref:Uncharacterized protein n=1 Tax=Echinococcus multilocularis TaxID=6211 RepID=A0A068Y2V2_ECHMU|nr:hypothetical protein EmuJ_000350000 [Echinococcus multilocularis]
MTAGKFVVVKDTFDLWNRKLRQTLVRRERPTRGGKLARLLRSKFSWKVSGSYTIDRCPRKRPTSECSLHSLTWRQEMPERICLLGSKWASYNLHVTASVSH